MQEHATRHATRDREEHSWTMQFLAYQPGSQMVSSKMLSMHRYTLMDSLLVNESAGAQVPSCSQRCHVPGLLEVKAVSHSNDSSSLGYQTAGQGT